ncbi:Chaperone protein dnaJ 15 [Vitis vinifera]|uniref:Chaperone protein dnaJ 15 n=1 Tax=Vitis vinifera TaxID=29760 RepID=A0A438ELD4_VITVI|nr:Chaperone protein dnaJ 15 [Vitis vinifera]
MIKFQALDSDSMDMEIDLSNLGTVNTMFAALFSKLGVPIKTTVSANVLEEALMELSQSDHFQLEHQSVERCLPGLHPFGFLLFKLLYFEQDANGGYGLALQ